jgi:hypothetical protein
LRTIERQHDVLLKVDSERNRVDVHICQVPRGDSDQFAAQIQDQLNELEAKRPQPVTT